MVRDGRFTFLCNLDERQAIAQLAKHLQRSQSDAVRFVVVEAVRQLTITIPFSVEVDSGAIETNEEENNAANQFSD